ncbi:mechanosensitive ion channel family protein [Noviherbaspirillum massiliense]|uniref:mechanosensitive ion channel family protein n=1 Tax=Noviherbaspirillum massiliense TaxID=1465823 RepID=UPI00030E3D44|nr:mechanosensitive ion channel domain-containing protein [Noviherbaspirillum massiliense]
MTGAVPDWTQTTFYAVMPWIVILNRAPWVWIVLEILVTLLLLLFLHRRVTIILLRITASLPYSHRVVAYGHRAGGIAAFLIMVQIILRHNESLVGPDSAWLHLNVLVLIGALTWLGVRCVRAIADTIVDLNPVHLADNLQARRIQTQTKVLARSVMVVIVVIGTGSALMTLPMLRQIGTSLLASAGAAGLVVGFAAKPVLSNLLAGLQIALTQPIRLDDVVIVQNEWGVIEEITGTYVVIRIWDQRRLIVPLQWFIENPFQNWTRTSADILGTVLIWVDYRLPIEPIRQEAERICRNAPEWDGRLVETQVVETSERAMQVRVLVSARDSGMAWHLRCRVREELIDFIQRNYPDSLPRTRAEVWDKDAGGAEQPAGSSLPPQR